MVYGRKYGEKTLNFEASGALKKASLIMRDRETDSWWSIMSGDAIGGKLQGTPLRELAVGEKTTWGKWIKKHPKTRVLSVRGKTHVKRNPYESYFTSERTFREAVAKDKRLTAKTPIFAFRLEGQAYASPFEKFQGGKIFPVGKQRVFLFREVDAAIYASTQAYLVPEGWDSGEDQAAQAVQEGKEGFQRISGFDTFWYTWTGINEKTKILE